jgi:hypothetical protein
MKARVIATLSALALAAALAPSPTLATDVSTVSYDLTTRQYDPMTAGEFDGRMRLRVSSDGIVSGTYMDTEGHISGVSGGMTGPKIWLKIGDRAAGGLHIFQGTLINGKLLATMGSHGGLHTWAIEGKSVTH